MSQMNMDAAQEEARNRWGNNARVRKYAPKERDRPIQYKVGISVLGGMFKAKGIGLSWEEAFKEADRRTKR